MSAVHLKCDYDPNGRRAAVQVIRDEELVASFAIGIALAKNPDGTRRPLAIFGNSDIKPGCHVSLEFSSECEAQPERTARAVISVDQTPTHTLCAETQRTDKGFTVLFKLENEDDEDPHTLCALRV